MSEVKDLLKQSKLDWNVTTEGLTTTSGLVVPDFKAVVREDTMEVLSVRGEDYEVFQNEQMMQLLYDISNKTGLQIHRGGSFGGGRKVYVQLKSDNLMLGKDRIEGWITAINSFDGSTSLAFGNSNVTISCQNTFFKSFKGLQNKIRHTKNMVIKIDDICRSMDNFLVEEKEIFRNIVQLSETTIGKDDIDTVIRKLFNVDKNISLNDDDTLSTVTKNKISKFYVDMNGELKEKGQNLWGLHSSVTKFTTHSLDKTNDGNMKNKIFSQIGNREREIFDYLVELV